MEFSFNGISSKDMNLLVKKSNHLSSFPKNLELVEIPGRTGKLIIDDESFGNKAIDIECILKSKNNLIEDAKNIAKWLQVPKGYKQLIFDDGAVFNAVCINQIDIQKIVELFGEVVISFEAEGENPNDTSYLR